MFALIFVGIGGIFGSISRFKIERLISSNTSTLFPLGTFFINLFGAFLLGIINAKFNGTTIYSLLGDGFLGAFTTYSTFMYGSVTLFQKNEYKYGILYIISSVLLGSFLYVAGFSISLII
ncbi:MAG: CrcB family protein [Spirochaetaceae bacterium]|nr:CrcB family protein [Spirochaetaceae bacterium]